MAKQQRLRILTYRWHVGHQYDLWKQPHEYTLAFGLTGLACKWDYGSRPLPDNATFRRLDLTKPLAKGQWDLAILHFDEFALRPELARGALSQDWGSQFRWMLENFPGPKIALCHGVPFFTGACDPDYDRESSGVIVDEFRRELVELLGDTSVVVNSHQAHDEWGFKNSRVIWHAFDPIHYPPCDADCKGILTVLGQLAKRPLYRGHDLYLDVMDRIGWQADLLGDSLRNQIKRPRCERKNYATDNEFGRANYQAYVEVLRRHGIYFNPTRRSPMPRTRGEAMMCGEVVVTTSPHDSAMFIDSGYNGFIADDPGELASILLELRHNQDLRRKVGTRGRQSALELFHVNRFARDWRETLDAVLSGGTMREVWSDPRAKAPSKPLAPEVAGGNGSAASRHGDPRRLRGILYVRGMHPNSGTNIYRVEHPVAALRKLGLHVDVVQASDLDARNLRLLEVGQYDAMVCHRMAESNTLRMLVETARKHGVLPVYDIDDLLYRREFCEFFVRLGRKTPESGMRDVARFKAALGHFGHALCTTPMLKESLEEEGVANVAIIENVLSDKVFTMSKAALAARRDLPENGRRVIAGYSAGSGTHKYDFEVVLPSLLRMLEEFPGFEVHILGELHVPPEMEKYGARVVKKPFMHWMLLPHALAELDINIAPLEDSMFCEAKSALKYFEAAAVNVPTIASSTVPYQQAITHNVTGMLAHTKAEWYDCLRALATDAALREKLGAAAHADTLARFTMDAMGTRLAETLTEWVHRPAPAAAHRSTPFVLRM